MEKPHIPKPFAKTAGEPNISSHLNNFPDTESLRKVIQRRPFNAFLDTATVFPETSCQEIRHQNSVFPK
ncbi:hypothetical protein CEXT_391001 [Caerostris extrusa]|uniref:Uncharacterized protein n=1 Tax=Caerostris extrusa TaxID=172846 RepID=A0AAV4XKQ8_CAEEX|nr:hypothetical protein CEXT_391001 [Caerostris extrusa]